MYHGFSNFTFWFSIRFWFLVFKIFPTTQQPPLTTRRSQSPRRRVEADSATSTGVAPLTHTVPAHTATSTGVAPLTHTVPVHPATSTPVAPLTHTVPAHPAHPFFGLWRRKAEEDSAISTREVRINFYRRRIIPFMFSTQSRACGGQSLFDSRNEGCFGGTEGGGWRTKKKVWW